jgi:hypothetical protein
MNSSNQFNDFPTKVQRRARMVRAESARFLCDDLMNCASTREANSLLHNLKLHLTAVNWISWSPRPAEVDRGAAGVVSVEKLWEVIDEHVTKSLERCEELIGTCQIETLKVKGHPEAALARAILEHHRTLASDWAQMRMVLLSEEEYARWRSFVTCGVKLQNKSAGLLNLSKSMNLVVNSSNKRFTPEIVTTLLGALLIGGHITKSEAIEDISLLADFVLQSHELKRIPVAIRPAWDRVSTALESQDAAMRVWELPLLFPRRLLLQSTVDETKGGDSLRATNESLAMLVADDYERLSIRLRYMPSLLDCISDSDAELPRSLCRAYRAAQANLIASASLLRALYKRQMFTLGDETGREAEMAELTEADLRVVDDDLQEPEIEPNWEEIQSASSAPRSTELRDHFFCNNPRFCEVCFRSAGSRKFCSLHINTKGQSRNEIKDAQQFLPQYKNALFNLLTKVREYGDDSAPLHADELLASDICAHSIKGLQIQTQTLLAKLVTHALCWLETDKIEGAQQQLQDAAGSINAKIRNVTVTPPTIWSASVSAVADLDALRIEIEELCSKVDLLNDPVGSIVPNEHLLGQELRQFSSAYTADILCRVAASCSDPQASTLLPEDLRRDFYIQWLRGYQPQFRLGHQAIMQARDADFIEAQFDESPFSTECLWHHFARMAAWRKAEFLPPSPKQRLRRLSRDAVIALRETGMSVEEIAQTMETTPDGVRAALARWAKRHSNIG